MQPTQDKLPLLFKSIQQTVKAHELSCQVELKNINKNEMSVETIIELVNRLQKHTQDLQHILQIVKQSC